MTVRLLFPVSMLSALLFGLPACGGSEDCPMICRQVGDIAGSTMAASICDVPEINDQDDGDECRQTSTALFD